MSNETNAGVTAPTEPLRTTLEEALAMAKERADARAPSGSKVMSVRYYPFAHYPWRVETESGRVKVYADWPPALSFVLGQEVVARDDAAELRAALADVMRVIAQHDDRGPHILPSDVWNRARAALAATEGES